MMGSFKNAVLAIVQPMGRITFNSHSKDNVKGADLLPEGTKDTFTNAGHYGVSVKVPKGVFGFFSNLFGFSDSPVIISHLDGKKPDATKDGQMILYVRKSGGGTFPVTIDFDPDGKLTLKADTEVSIQAPTINATGTTVNITGSTAVNVNAQNATVTAGTKATITAPTSEINAATKLDINSPLVNVSGVVNCAGIGAGAPAVAGKAVIAGDLEAQQVKDSKSSMDDMRTVFNGHKHDIGANPPIDQM